MTQEKEEGTAVQTVTQEEEDAAIQTLIQMEEDTAAKQRHRRRRAL